MQLRDYQQDSIDRLRRSIATRHRAPLLVQPCGTGKTMVATEIIRAARDKAKSVVFYAPRRELVYQCSEELFRGEQMHGLIMAGTDQKWGGIQVASFDTVWARQSKGHRLPPADVVIVDEAHLSISKTRQTIIRQHLAEGAVVIGLTATPARGDGKGLGQIYDDMIESRSVQWFIDNGYLVPARYFAPTKPDLNAIKVARGDYVVDQLGEAVDRPKLVGDIITQWKRLAPGKSTVVFCVNRAHSRHVCDAFLEAGVRAEHLDGETPNNERAEILKRVRSGETTVLCNVFVATYGLDIPSLECAVLARPTKNITLYHQTLGRVMRIAPGKTEAIVIDHAGAVDEHGLFADPVPWDLHPDEKVTDRKDAQAKERKEPKDITCPNCKTVFRARVDCPNCGHRAFEKREDIPYHEADLEEVKDPKAKRNRTESWAQKQEFIGGLRAIASKRGYKDGWVAHAYSKRYGVWPNDPRVKHAPATAPSQDVTGFVKHLQIRNAKRREAAHG